jgi:NAD-dependent dihydropyrimidine dehydrogenase PreA subunit
MKDFVYLKNVVTLQLNEEKCNSCGMCVMVCPRAVFMLSGGKAHIINRDFCMECGACALNCPKMALIVNSGLGCGCATGVIEGFFKGNKTGCECSKGC